MTENHFWSHFSPFQINTQLFFFIFFSQNGCQRPFWMTENHFRMHFSPFQINTQLFSQNGCQRPFWTTENHFWSHFSSFQINTQLLFLNFFFTKWLPAAILDDRKSLSIAFLAISDFNRWWYPSVVCIYIHVPAGLWLYIGSGYI